jgi:uncharacterized protein (TIGR00296 family)
MLTIVVSATKDRRFSPVQLHEVPQLKCNISLLVNFEIAKDVWDWEIGKHGIRIEFRDPKTNKSMDATYLPDVCVDQGWSKDECLVSLYEKAGYTGKITQELLDNTILTRYQSSKKSLTYEEYKKMVVNKFTHVG